MSMAGLCTHLTAAEDFVVSLRGMNSGPGTKGSARDAAAILACLEAPDAMDAFMSGTVFPDWGYRGVNDDAAEAAHWNPFTDAFADLIAERRYRRSFSGFEERDRPGLIAFLLGVLLHDAIDEYWHFDVDGGKSFLSEAKQREGLSHGEVERYCDFMLLREHGTPRLCGRYPELAILDVYRGMGIDVESRQLKTGYAKMEKEIRLYSARAKLPQGNLRRRCAWTFAHFLGEEFSGAKKGALMAFPAMKKAIGRESER